MMNDERSIIKCCGMAPGYLLKEAEIEDLKQALHDVIIRVFTSIISSITYHQFHPMPTEEITEQEKLMTMSERERISSLALYR